MRRFLFLAAVLLLPSLGCDSHPGFSYPGAFQAQGATIAPVRPQAAPVVHFVVPLVVQPVPQPVPQVVPVGSVLEIAIDGMTPDLAKRVDICFYPRPAGIRCRAVTDWGNSAYRVDFSTPLAGTYLIRLCAPPADATGAVVGSEIEVVVGDVAPPEPPKPPDPPQPPQPPIPPVPVVQKIQAVIIEETAESTPAFATVRNSKAIRDYISKGGHRAFFVDKDAAAAATGTTWPGWATRAAGKTLPMIFITPIAGGEPVYEGPCPQTIAEFMALAQKYGGPPVAVVPAADCPSGLCPVGGTR